MHKLHTMRRNSLWQWAFKTRVRWHKRPNIPLVGAASE